MAGLVPFNRRSTSLFNSGFEDFYNMLDDFFNDNWPSSGIMSRGSFRIDIQEDDRQYIVEAELPRVNKEEINLELNDGRLTISVVREEKKEEEKKNYVHRESHYSSMSRSVYLANAAEEGITAKMDNGILRIIVPKQDSSTMIKKIDIE
jgi:HSP20 family protein